MLMNEISRATTFNHKRQRSKKGKNKVDRRQMYGNVSFVTRIDSVSLNFKNDKMFFFLSFTRKILVLIFVMSI